MSAVGYSQSPASPELEGEAANEGITTMIKSKTTEQKKILKFFINILSPNKDNKKRPLL